MMTSFVLTMALAAPVPVAPPAPVASGPVPRLMEIKADSNGKVIVTVTRTEMVQVGAGNAIAPGGAAPAIIKRAVTTTKTVELGEVKDLTIATADGKKVEVADAAKQLKDGAVVVVSADGKPVSPAHLKLFKDNVLVLVSPELVTPTGGANIGGRPGIRPVPPVQIQPLPANPGNVQIQPGVIQIQIAPAVPAQPAPVPEK